MATRQFSLQPALSYKERLEDVCQMALAEIEASYAREHSIFDLLSELERKGYRELEHQHRLGELDVAMISACFGDLQELQKKIERQLVILNDLAEKAERKREELIEISKEKKALERLKEKHERKVAQAMMRAENKFMDDIATSQFHRRQMGK